MDEIHRSSKRSDWESPPELITDLKTVFPFDLDACASRPNVCETFCSPEDDGLMQPWRGLVWLNPPYGRHQHIDRWVWRARMQAQKPGCTVVALLPARTGTVWWHETVPHATMCVFIKGRLQFHLPGGEPAPYSAGFPSALVVWGQISTTQAAKLASYGWPVAPYR